MITIVTYFGEQVVKFIFGGRNSGQGQPKAVGNRDGAGLCQLWLFKRAGLVQGGKRLM